MIAMNCFFKSLESAVFHAAARRESLSKLEQEIGYSLPASYAALMTKSNGLEGFLGNGDYIMFWPIEDLLDLNQAYGVNRLAKALLLFGSNGGDTGYAFDTRSNPMAVIEVPFVEIGTETPKIAGSNFEEFIERLIP